MTEEVHWRFVWSTWAFLGGILGGLGVALLLQQFAVVPFSIGLFVTGALVGLVVGVLAPSLVLAIALAVKRPSGGAS